MKKGLVVFIILIGSNVLWRFGAAGPRDHFVEQVKNMLLRHNE